MRLRILVLASVALMALGVLPASWAAGGNPAFDRSFSRDGVAALRIVRRGEWFGDVVPTPAGRVYAVGETWTRTSNRGLVAAYTNRGRLDRSFSGNGYLLTEVVPGNSRVMEGIALPSGKLLVAGQSRSKAFVMQLREDGRMDRSFAGGYRFLPQPDTSSGFVQVAADSVGNTYFASDNMRSERPYRASILVTKLSPEGSVVRSFGERGQIRLAFAPGLEVTGLAVDSQDRPVILVSISNRRGSPTSRASLVRLTTNGEWDATFNGTGRVGVRLPSGAPIWPVDLDILATDDVVVGSKAPASTSTGFAVHKILSGGVPDPSYSSDGVAYVRSGLRLASYPGSGALMPDGSYTFASGVLNRKDYLVKGVLLRITPGGALDRTFGQDGLFRPELVDGREFLIRPTVDTKGRLLVTGQGPRAALLVRLTVTY